MLFPHYILDIFTSLSYSNSTKQTKIIMKLWRDCTCNLSEWSSRILWNCWWSAISPETSHNKEKQAMPWVPNKARAKYVTGCHGCFPFSQSSLWTNRGESRVVGSLCKRLALHHWWAFGSRGCEDYVFFDENPVSLFLFPLLKDNFLVMCQYCACTTTIMVLNKISQLQDKQLPRAETETVVSSIRDTSVRNLDHQVEAMKHVPNPKFSLLAFQVLFFSLIIDYST